MYDSWLDSDVEKYSLYPFDIDKDIYENYEIKIDVVPKENKYFEVIIKDRGTGISIESLKAMGEVAKSYKERKTIRNEINEMPSWLKPTGGFGIGIQTAFLINKEFIAYTKSTLTDKVLEIVFESRNKNGYIQANNSEHKMQRGTEFHILVKKDNFKYSLGGFVSNYISSGYDPMNNDDLLAYRILDSVQEYCNSIFIPVSINYNNVNLPKKTYENMSFKNSNNSYNYSISDSFDEIYIWDKDSCSYIRMKMGFKSANYRIDVYYKGIAVNKGVSEINEIPYIYCYIDTHGFNMKQILKLNREELTKYGIKAVADIYYKAGELFMKVINKALEDGKSIDSNIVTVFLLLAPRFKINVDNSRYKDLVKDSKYEIKVVEKDNGKFVEGTKSINDIIDNYPNFNYLNIEDFRVYGLKKIDYNMDSILKALNSKITEIDTNFIIADEKFIDNMLKYCKIESIRYIKTHKSKTLIIYRINEKNLSDFINTDKYTRDEFVKMLVYDQKKSNRSHRLIDINSERSCIPAMEDYKDLAVSKIPHGISQVQDKVNIVISPLTKSDGNYIKNINNYDSFIDNIVKRNDYQNLLDYVYENRLEDNKVTRDDIDELYRKLIKEYYDLIKNKNN
ncbi:MAG TPA: hypothetical protein DG753_05695 [Clostridium sp.]|nr:hypothetical protein [Clostridium sp.]